MMADAATYVAAGNRVSSHTKPEIFKTADGKLIVENEFLNQEETVIMASNNSLSEESERLLFEICLKTTQCCISHKDINNIKPCLKVLNECGEDIPRFVSHYLDDLPPVTFGSIDVSALLGRTEQLNKEVSSMKRTLEAQANVCEDPREVIVAVDRRVATQEKPRGSTGLDHITGAVQEGDVQCMNTVPL